MKIFKNRFYVYSPAAVDMASYGKVLNGCSRDYIVAGSVYSSRTSLYRVGFMREFTGDGNVYRVPDGRMPDYQRRVSGSELVAYMRQWTYGVAYPVTPDEQRAAAQKVNHETNCAYVAAHGVQHTTEKERALAVAHYATMRQNRRDVTGVAI